jgi:pimeloyl-ACP methyl ester carboxylesterase
VPFFDSAGVPIHYETFGDQARRPLVLVHGFASSLQGNWLATGCVDALTPLRYLIALDCRGHGESGKPHEPEAYADPAMPDDVIRLMDHLAIERADLFGYSMGGRISIQLMVRYPERFTSVILGGVGGIFQTPGSRSNVVDALLAEEASTVTDARGKAFRVFAERNGNDLKALAACMAADRATGDAASLSRVAVPVLIVNGEEDRTVGDPAPLAAAIPRAQLVKIPGRDHLTVVGDQRFKDAARDFLQSLQSGVL